MQHEAKASHSFLNFALSFCLLTFFEVSPIYLNWSIVWLPGKGCGTDEFMELISFTDKNTGKPRQAWKCQQCQKWHWSKNGRGR